MKFRIGLKTFKKSLFVLLFLIGTILTGLYFSGNMHLIRAVRFTYLSGQSGPSIDEFKRFPSVTLKAVNPEPWPMTFDHNRHQPDPKAFKTMSDYSSVAFAVFHCDSVLFEHYWEGYDANRPSNSFSMAKSIVSLAVGVCLDEGLIKSLDDEVENYIGRFADTGLTVRHVLQMRSNINFDEKYGDPFGFVSRAYYGDDQLTLLDNYELVGQPGTEWEYLSGNTLLLALIVEKASGMGVADFVNDRIWRHLAPENEALWITDEEGLEKAFCCFISTARDFARFGKLVMQRGYWDGKPIVSEAYITEMLNPVMVTDAESNMVDYYGMQWWLGQYENHDFFYMRGMLGQYVICFPEEDLIIVRLGHKRSKEKINNIPVDMYAVMDAGWSVYNQRK